MDIRCTKLRGKSHPHAEHVTTYAQASSQKSVLNVHLWIKEPKQNKKQKHSNNPKKSGILAAPCTMREMQKCKTHHVREILQFKSTLHSVR